MWVKNIDDIPEGFIKGSNRPGNITTLGKVSITNGINMIYINNDSDIPEGWILGTNNKGKSGYKKVINLISKEIEFINNKYFDETIYQYKVISKEDRIKNSIYRKEIVNSIKELKKMFDYKLPYRWHCAKIDKLESLLESLNDKTKQYSNYKS